MLGTLATSSELTDAVRRRGRRAGLVIERGTNGVTILMAGTGSHETVVAGPSGCLIGLSANLPVPGGDINAFADDLLSAFLEHGPDFIGDRPGQFSMVIWDPSDGFVHLYRDRIGVPPLFYWMSDGGLAWATSIRALLDLGAGRDVDELALGHYQLTGYVQAPRTMVASVRKIPAAHRLTVSADTKVVHRYWEPTWEPKPGTTSSEDSERVESLMVQAIERVTPPSGRLGLLLSSGIDSVGLAVAARQVAHLELDAFTFTYAEYEGILNENQAAKAVADHLGIRHHEIQIGPDYLRNELTHLLRVYEEPFSYGVHSVRMDPISEHGIEVVMTGAEGATWAYSRAWTTGMALDRLIPERILKRVHGLTNRIPGTPHDLRTVLSIAAASNTERYLRMSQQQLLGVEHAAATRTDGTLVYEAQADLAAELERAVHTGPRAAEDKIALLGLSSFGPENLTWWSHRWAKTAGLSVRFPLLDFDYINYMAQKRRRDKDKIDRRRMAARYLPSSLAEEKQLPQAIPLSEWLRGPLSEWVQSILTKNNVVDEGTFAWEKIGSCIEEHTSGAADHKWCIWTCLTFILWKQEVLRRAT